MISMGYQGDINGISMGYQWDINGISMGFMVPLSMVPQIDPVNADAQSYTSLGSTSAGGPHMLLVVGGWTCRLPKPNDSEF